ncbi:GntR family transcriptional regulator [Variovorax sp. WS11]|uniref:aminotransferase-like domain-containing protein n=1 Tax=Variovorax sp. WS11 TaxID=1105204 RepID=UPI000D0DB524|nr:PLP-dependent aminotransferase family protein [Variovorax sp. WS11]NDZ15754.1 PLP-dependent aminotransferase family protein [Variovorax sp. WS11]PSL82883.1 GntR family transcriptional regulator [Variovorax sp. WS11]
MNTITTHWRKQLRNTAKPAYLLLAELIADDIKTGRLGVRDRLPTLRELAADLNLNYTTVARGYAEARKRGLIDSRAGTGTFIRSGSPSLRLRGGSGAEMTMNMPPEPDDEHLMARLHDSASRAFAQLDLHGLLRYQDFGGTAQDREAAMRWLRPFVPDASVDRILVCPGIHSVLTALFSQLARPGELICVESLTYPGVKAIAAQLGVQLHALQMDDDGPIADTFEHACKTLKPKALYCNPTLLNPTAATVSRARREALADVALRYAVPIIEDDAYGMLPRQSPAALATLAPGLTYYLSGFSKCFGAGLRSAYVCSPTVVQSRRLAGAMRATTVMASPITNALTTLWVEDGTAGEMLQAVRAESVARQVLAARYLGDRGLQAHPEGFHAWLPLTPGWSPVEFASYLRTQNVGVVASAAFSTDGDPPDAVRICLGGPMSREQCDQALRLIADTLTHPLHPHATLRDAGFGR